MNWIEWTEDHTSKSILASLIINAYTSIILLTRRKLREDEFAVSSRVVQAARMVLKAMFLFEAGPQESISGTM